MHRTTLLLPQALKIRMDHEAQTEKISVGELIRRAVEKYLLGRSDPWGQDPFLSSPTTFEVKGASNLSTHMDALLYSDSAVHETRPKKKEKSR